MFLYGLKIKVFWTMFSYVQGQTFTNLDLKLPLPADCLIPASTEAGVCYIQSAVALPPVEQEPTDLSGARTDCCGLSENEHVHQTSSILVGYSSTSLCLLLSAWKVLSISLKSGSELQVQGDNTWLLCCCGCMSPARGIAQSVVPGFVQVPLEIVAVRLKGVERLGS